MQHSRPRRLQPGAISSASLAPPNHKTAHCRGAFGAADDAPRAVCHFALSGIQLFNLPVCDSAVPENNLFYVPECIANKCGVKFAGNVKDMGVMGRSKINCPSTLFYIGIIVALAFLLHKENAIVVAQMWMKMHFGAGLQ
jgi:hypothetical protein